MASQSGCIRPRGRRSLGFFPYHWLWDSEAHWEAYSTAANLALTDLQLPSDLQADYYSRGGFAIAY